MTPPRRTSSRGRPRRPGCTVLVGYMKRFAVGYQRAQEIMGRPGFGAPTLGSFSWSMGPFADRFGMRDWLFENVVHHFDLARFFFGELSDVHVVRGPGPRAHRRGQRHARRAARSSASVRTRRAAGSSGTRRSRSSARGTRCTWTTWTPARIGRRSVPSRCGGRTTPCRERQHDRCDDGLRARARALPRGARRGRDLRVRTSRAPPRRST